MNYIRTKSASILCKCHFKYKFSVSKRPIRKRIYNKK